ncbi:MAG: hypothetical protein ACE1ZC_05275 [Nitrososphaerales archaeon]
MYRGKPIGSIERLGKSHDYDSPEIVETNSFRFVGSISAASSRRTLDA